MADKNTLDDLLADEIRMLYSAERQLTKALPKMAKAATDPKLHEIFTEYLGETEKQLKRLEQIAQILNIEPSGMKCAGMEGCIKDGGETLREDGEADILDLALIGRGCRIEHYEMAGYETAIRLAEHLEAGEIVKLLDESLREKQDAERKLRKAAGRLLKSASGSAKVV